MEKVIRAITWLAIGALLDVMVAAIKGVVTLLPVAVVEAVIMVAIVAWIATRMPHYGYITMRITREGILVTSLPIVLMALWIRRFDGGTFYEL